LDGSVDVRRLVVRYALAGVPICAIDLEAAAELILAVGSRELPSRFHFSSAKDIVEAASDPRFRQVLNAADFVLPDGMPLAWIGRSRGYRVDRVSGPDAMLAVLDRGRGRGARHYFYGGVQGVAHRLADAVVGRLPGLAIAGYETPPFRPLTAEESEATIGRINAARPTHVWVGMSSPKQDYWIAAHVDKLRCGAVLSVGAAFDFLAGTRRRAPQWMQKSGTEWFYRLLSEPRRLGRRYTVTNSRFLAIVAREIGARPKAISPRLLLRAERAAPEDAEPLEVAVREPPL
jgi:N-acetylglucosaminyldiphosphoundecaprenol N-acetyl-beta-D-mannosaminyltransferase